MGDPPDCLWRKMNDPRHHRGGLSVIQLLQSDRPEHHTDLLNSRPKDLLNRLLIRTGKRKLDRVS